MANKIGIIIGINTTDQIIRDPNPLNTPTKDLTAFLKITVGLHSLVGAYGK